MKRDNTQRINQGIAKINGDVIKEASPGSPGGGNSHPAKPTPQKDRQSTQNDDSTERKGAGEQRNDDDNLDTDVEGTSSEDADVERGSGAGQRRSTSVER